MKKFLWHLCHLNLSNDWKKFLWHLCHGNLRAAKEKNRCALCDNCATITWGDRKKNICDTCATGVWSLLQRKWCAICDNCATITWERIEIIIVSLVPQEFERYWIKNYVPLVTTVPEEFERYHDCLKWDPYSTVLTASVQCFQVKDCREWGAHHSQTVNCLFYPGNGKIVPLKIIQSFSKTAKDISPLI